MINNESDHAITFEFYNDSKNIFGFSKTKGKIKEHSD